MLQLLQHLDGASVALTENAVEKSIITGVYSHFCNIIRIMQTTQVYNFLWIISALLSCGHTTCRIKFAVASWRASFSSALYKRRTSRCRPDNLRVAGMENWASRQAKETILPTFSPGLLEHWNHTKVTTQTAYTTTHHSHLHVHRQTDRAHPAYTYVGTQAHTHARITLDKKTHTCTRVCTHNTRAQHLMVGRQIVSYLCVLWLLPGMLLFISSDKLTENMDWQLSSQKGSNHSTSVSKSSRNHTANQ